MGWAEWDALPAGPALFLRLDLTGTAALTSRVSALKVIMRTATQPVRQKPLDVSSTSAARL